MRCPRENNNVEAWVEYDQLSGRGPILVRRRSGMRRLCVPCEDGFRRVAFQRLSPGGGEEFSCLCVRDEAVCALTPEPVCEIGVCPPDQSGNPQACIYDFSTPTPTCGCGPP